MLQTLELAGVPRQRWTAPRTTRWSSRAATPRSTRSRSPTSSMLRCSATASRPCWRSARASGVEGRGRTTRGGGRRRAAAASGRAPAGSTSRRFYDVEYLLTAGSSGSRPNTAGVPWRVGKHTVMDLDAWPYPKTPLVPLAESVHECASVEIFRGCTRGCRFRQAGISPARCASGPSPGGRDGREGVGRHRLRGGRPADVSGADDSEIAAIAHGLAGTATRAPRRRCRCLLTRVDVFNIDLANELTRNGRRSGLTFAPEGGSGTDPQGPSTRWSPRRT